MLVALTAPSRSPAGEKNDDNKQPIKIAAIFSETGIAASHNKPLIDMTVLAVNALNAQGGVLGRPLQLIRLDNESTPIGAALASQEAVARQVTAVIGAHWSSHSLVMAPILQKAGIPMISPGSTNPAVTVGRDYIFRACFIDSFQGLAMAKFALEDLKAHSAVVVINVDEDYSITLGQFFSNGFQKGGGEVRAELSYRGTATDFSKDIETISKLAPDVVYLPGYTRDSGLFIKQAAKMGVQVTFLGGDAWDEIEQYAGSAVENSYQSAPWHPEVPYPANARMKKVYTETYHAPIGNISSPLAWDAVMLLGDAITRAKNIDRRAIRDALAATKYFPGATGPITFDTNGDPRNKPIFIIRFTGEKRIFTEAITP